MEHTRSMKADEELDRILRKMRPIRHDVEKKRRDTWEIRRQILESAKGGISQTAVMYNANLSYGMMQKHLWWLLMNGCIAYANGKYITTEMGQEALELLRELSNVLRRAFR